MAHKVKYMQVWQQMNKGEKTDTSKTYPSWSWSFKSTSNYLFLRNIPQLQSIKEGTIAEVSSYVFK